HRSILARRGCPPPGYDPPPRRAKANPPRAEARPVRRDKKSRRAGPGSEKTSPGSVRRWEFAASRVLWINPHVTGAAHRANELRSFRIVPKLLAQRRDVNVHRTVEDFVMAVADLVQEGFARFDPAFGARQAQEQIELDR